MTHKQIKTIVCSSFNVEETDFVIFGRSLPHSHARYAYFVLCWNYTPMTKIEIAKTVLMKYDCVQKGLKRHMFLMINNRDYSFAFKYAESAIKIQINNYETN